jgi:4-amino-4-deoxy-L-arabinose transferase-like glycosyltransferase
MNPIQPYKSSQKFLLLGILVFFFGVVIWIRLRLLGVPLERDEGEYAYIAQQLLQGILPYTESLSMKFPGIFFTYAGILAFFGESHEAIHLSLLFFNLATAFLIFLLGRNLLGLSAGIVAATCYSVLTLSPSLQGIWANSEHFVLLPALGGILLLRTAQNQPVRFFLSGLLLGCSLLIKQHAILFCLFGAVYLASLCFRKSHPLNKPISILTLFGFGGLLPLIITASLYAATENFSDFWFSTFQYSFEYISLTPLEMGLVFLQNNFAAILESNFPILILSLIGLSSAIWRKDLRQEFIYLLAFFVCSFLAITPGLYFRPHYFILCMPALSLLAGAGFESLTNKFSAGIKTIIPLGILTLVLGLPILAQRDFFFNLPVAQVTRLTYGTNPFFESLEISKYISEHSNKEDKIAILGSEPQIYFYSKRKSATRHLYMYPLMENHTYALSMQSEMIQEIEMSQPKFIVLTIIPSSWLSRPQSPTQLLTWAQDYLKQNYETSGVVDIISPKETVYKWGEQANEYNPRSSHYLLIKKRRT